MSQVCAKVGARAVSPTWSANVAQSKCLGCGGVRFEIHPIELAGCKWKNYAVQCASCGGVVGTLPYFNTNQIIRQLAEKLGVTIKE